MEILGFIDIDNRTTKEEVTVDRFSGGMIKFSVPHQISRDHAFELQKQLSYHPHGYGIYSFEATPRRTTWECSNSCD